MISPAQKPFPDYKQHVQEIDIHAVGGILSKTPSKWETADPHLRRSVHWDRLYSFITSVQEYIQ